MRFSFDFNDTPHRIYGIWPMTPFPLEVSIYGVCAHSCAYCNEANQEVLMYNGHLRKLKDIKVGDIVMGWTSEIYASQRRFCPSTVEEVFTRRANVKKISLVNGTTLVCTPEHNWYTHKSGENPYRRVTLETGNAPRADAYLITQAWDSDHDEMYKGDTVNNHITFTSISNMEDAGEADVVSLRTSTHNYIVNRTLSRNCFSNLGRAGANRKPHTKNSLQTLINGFERARRDEYSPIGFFLREKYPICFSNTTDPFMPQEKAFRCSEAFMKYAKTNGLPLFIQTKGGILYEERERYIDYLVPGKDVVYMTLTTLDDELIKKIEPGAPTATERLKLTEYLASHDIPVILAPNPYVKDWIPNEKEYCRIAKDAGARGIWQTHLHLNETQREVLARENDPLDLAHLVDKVDAAHMNRQVKDWYIAAEAVGLDIYTNQNFAPYFGNREKHEEAANPAWLGGKVFDYVMKIPKFLNRLAYRGRPAYDEDFKPVTPDYVIPYSWGGIEALLRVQNCPNPTLNVSDFWYPYNTKIGADRQEFAHTLGKRNTLYNILRYFFNHPWENNAFSFTKMNLITVGDNGARMILDSGDMIYTFYPFDRYNTITAYDGRYLEDEQPPKGEYLFLDSLTDEDIAYLWGEYMS